MNEGNSTAEASALKKFFFGPEHWKLADKGSELERLFSRFYFKLQEQLKRFILLKLLFRRNRKPIRDDGAVDQVQYNHLGIPIGEYRRELTTRVLIEVDKDDKSDLSDVPSTSFNEYVYALSCFVFYEGRQKYNKLRKLRDIQMNLPIFSKRDEVIDLLNENKVLIIAGDTGCGKSTQVPQYLLDAEYDHIACTQPRRIAATSLARRVAYETLDEYGSRIAYQIRFEKSRTLKTRLLFLTEGLLLRQIQSDHDLQQYNVIILDEVHERNLTGDFLMGLLRDLVNRRNDLKLILMSATINLELFTNYFKGAPVVQVPGRLYPIELHYIPVKEYDDCTGSKKKPKIDASPYLNVLQMIDAKIPQTERGDALVFLNGISEITVVAEALKVYAESNKRWVILMLYSTLSVEEQDKVFDIAPTGVRKCIICTNIAETSVTIDGIRFVIDSGKVNLLKYDSKTGVHSLREYWTSQASADQRKGRAGRTGPGICYRLYSKEQFSKMDKFTISEINRVSLQSIAMQIVNLNMNISPLNFPFIEKPDMGALEEAIESLWRQGILVPNDSTALTSLGKIVASLPVEIPVAKMLIYGCVLDQTEISLTLAACLSVSSPFTTRSFRELDVMDRRQNMMSDNGDPFALLNAFKEFVQLHAEHNEIRRWGREKGIDTKRMYEISQLRRQFKDLLEDSGLITKELVEDNRIKRINAGERKRLNELKKDVRFEVKKRKVLKSDSHYDTIMDNIEDGYTTMDSVLEAEFYLRNRESGIGKILKSHKLNDEIITVVKTIVTAGVYPQYAILDQYNVYKVGNELFAHTRLKPFAMLHPNSCLSLMPEALDYERSDQNLSRYHQLISFATFMETSKPFLCQNVRIPALLLLLFAKTVVCASDEYSISCDDFIVFKFRNGAEYFPIINNASSIRKALGFSLKSRLDGQAFENTKDLIRNIIEFARTNVEFIMMRKACPNLEVEIGFFLPSGERVDDCEDSQDSAVQMFLLSSGDFSTKVQKESSNESSETSKKKIQYKCEACNKILEFDSAVEIKLSVFVMSLHFKKKEAENNNVR
uniref:ATP-dependent RNA helicase DHX34 n=1 Tax=Syphacia muris TaxID=451379 RepID=A0A0N5ALD2_9BILA